uniref:Uncharacterized protein n=1 Tax=Rhizophora mucronata TaxID=61149 RepID=A0A2P2ITG1_RHIMU
MEDHKTLPKNKAQNTKPNKEMRPKMKLKTEKQSSKQGIWKLGLTYC